MKGLFIHVAHSSIVSAMWFNLFCLLSTLLLILFFLLQFVHPSIASPMPFNLLSLFNSLLLILWFLLAVTNVLQDVCTCFPAVQLAQPYITTVPLHMLNTKLP